MIIHYIKTFLRTCARNKGTTAIHVIGLSLGMAACALLAIFVGRELSYDTQWKDKDRIHRMHVDFTIPGRDTIKSVHAMGPLRDPLMRKLPQIESAARMHRREGTFRALNQSQSELKEDKVSFVDPEFFDLFEVEVLEGDLDAIRKDPSAIVVTPEFAQRNFGTQDVIGKRLSFEIGDTLIEYVIAGRIARAPLLSDFEWESLALLHPQHFAKETWVMERWFASNVLLYLKLRPDAKIEEFHAAFPAFVDSEVPSPPLGRKNAPAGEFVLLHTTPLDELHLSTEYPAGMKNPGDASRNYIYLGIAILVLLIAAINFINLSVARAMNRAREISIRKVLGASRNHVVMQVTLESILLCLGSLLIAFVWIELLGDAFFEAVRRPRTLQEAPLAVWGLAAGAFAILLGVVSGFYPALVISRFQPARVLKSNQSTSSRASTMARSALISIQFVISSALVIWTGVMWAQNDLALHRDLGYDHQALISIGNLNLANDSAKVLSFQRALDEVPGVRMTTLSGVRPGRAGQNNLPVVLEGSEDQKTELLGAYRVGSAFFETLNVPFIAGHDLSDKRGVSKGHTLAARQAKPDTVLHASTVINRSAVKFLGFKSPQEAIGKRLTSSLEIPNQPRFAPVSYKIVGVIDDISFGSLHHSIEPTMFTRMDESNVRLVLAQLDSSTLQESLDKTRELAAQWFPNLFLTVEPVDQAFYQAYDQERRSSSLMAGAGLSALGVAILGLFGLSMYVVRQQSKEIGVRKVFGAPSAAIIRLMFRRFCTPLLFASLLGCALGLYFSSRWLEQYTERVDLGSDGLILALLTVGFHLAIAALAVAPHTFKISRMHPRLALRRE